MSERQLPVPPLRIPFESLPSKFGGYDRAATRKLLEEISAVYEALWLEFQTLRGTEAELKAELARRDEAEQPVDAALADATGSAAEIIEAARREAQLALKKARVRAEKAARRIEREATAKAEKILTDARRQRPEIGRAIPRRDEAELPAAAAEIIEDARGEAQLALKKARARAEKILNEARRDRRKIELEIAHMDAHKSESREELAASLLAPLKWYGRGLDARTPDAEVLEPKLEETRSHSEEVPERRGSSSRVRSSRRPPLSAGSGLERIAAILEEAKRSREPEARGEIEEATDASA